LTYNNVICNDFDQFCEAANGWSLDFNQLDIGRFSGKFTLIDTEQILLANIRVNRQIE